MVVSGTFEHKMYVEKTEVAGHSFVWYKKNMIQRFSGVGEVETVQRTKKQESCEDIRPTQRHPVPHS